MNATSTSGWTGVNAMPRVYGEGWGEMHRQTEDGRWTHTRAEGRTFATLEESQDDFYRTGHGGNTRLDPSEYIFAAIFVIITIIGIIFR